MMRAVSLHHVITVIAGGRGGEEGKGEERLGRRERGREIGEESWGREVGKRDGRGERGRGGEERHHMTTTVPCRGVSIIYIYNVHVHDEHYVYTCGVCERQACVCVCVCACVRV